jgi:hypothetical protein
MRVLLFHLDGKLPNIALMRIAAHHRERGDEVVLRHAGNPSAIEPEMGDAFDVVYGSLIFERTKPVAERLLQVRPDAIVGGTGWRVDSTLEEVGIETREQDYSIYPRFKPSIGFSQRGCRLRCEFCVVPRKEGKIRDEQTTLDIWRGDPHPKHLLLLDNDFFGAPSWRQRIDEIRAGGFRVCFSQGINARMISDDAAKAIASVDYRDDSFKVKRIYTAWDNKDDEKVLFRGLDRLAAAGVKPDHVMVYMLVGYWAGETHVDREYRRKRLREWGARPYPMPFRRTPELVGFQRWVIGAYDKRIGWDEWKRAAWRPEKLGDRTDTQTHLPLFNAEQT